MKCVCEEVVTEVDKELKADCLLRSPSRADRKREQMTILLTLSTLRPDQLYEV
jgi:hypothetical protein